MGQKFKPHRVVSTPSNNAGDLSFVRTPDGSAVKGFLAGNDGVPLPFFLGSSIQFLPAGGTPPDPAPPNSMYVSVEDRVIYFVGADGQVFVNPISEGNILAKLYYESAQTPVSVFGSTPQNIVTMTRTFTPGMYMIDLCYGWTCDSVQYDFIGTLKLDGAPIGQPHQQEPKDSAGSSSWTNTNQTQTAMKRLIVDLSDGQSHTLEFEIRSSDDFTEVSAFDATLLAWNLTELNA